MDQWKELLAYWQARHVEGRPPSRQDIDPAVDLPLMAANLLIADVVAEGYRYRLVGSAVVERHKQEMTGKLAGSSHFLERVRPQLLQSFNAVRDDRKPRLLKTGSSEARDYATAATLVLPLVTASGQTDKLLIGVFFDRRYEAVDQVDFMDVSQPTI
jgi:hypothetical protein